MNTFTGKEWGSGKEDPSLFNPANLDCGQWAEAARDFGAQSLTFLCKHHDGFCMWPSAYTRHSVKYSPWKAGQGDVVREISEACRKAGLKFGIYLSPADLNHPAYGRDAAKYNDYYCGQLTELLTNYGEICEVFLDGAQPSPLQQGYDFQRYYRVIRELQPNAVISMRGPDVRWVGNEIGQARESEWSVVPIPVPPDKYDWPDRTALDLGSRKRIEGAKSLHWHPATAAVSLRRQWFWHPGQDSTIKSLPELLRIYRHTVGRNAVLQLNLSSDNTGRIPDLDVARLREFGDALRSLFTTNLVAGIGTTVEPMRTEADGTFMQRLKFQKPRRIKHVVLQEDITKGQRVEAFEVALCEGGKTNKVLQATTIGWKRILDAGDVSAEELLLHITQTRAPPFVTLSAY
ncbi:MAG TPA: alpha-L-fucosidase [Verrucomicrobiae bacterium]